MGLFNWKKKEAQHTIPELSHEHTYKDMPWYMKEYYNGPNEYAGYRIIEPYICIECGKRIDKVLEEASYEHITVEAREKIYKQVRDKYKKYLKPQAVVEDMINNILLVRDPDHLHMVETMRGLPHKKCGTSAEMEWPQDERAPSLKVNR